MQKDGKNIFLFVNLAKQFINMHRRKFIRHSNYIIKLTVPAIVVLFVCPNAGAQKNLSSKFDAVVEKIQPKCIAWRRHLHQNPELANREFKTAKFIAGHLRTLGLEVTEGIAHTGVVGILKTGKPGPVIGLRAEMDAVPVTEPDSLPFASKVTTEYDGQQTGVMHACGHDLHMAILMSVAEILSGMKKDLSGIVKFIFQPAEEGDTIGTGAALMMKAGVLQDPKVDVVFALHVSPTIEVGKIGYRPGGFYAGANDFRIIVKGRSGLSARPWNTIDPIVTSAQIIMGLQSIISRNLNITENAGIISISSVNTNAKPGLIPGQVELYGTLRAMSTADEKMMTERVKTIVMNIAESGGATATVDIPYGSNVPPVFNHEQLTQSMLPSLQKAAGMQNVLYKSAATVTDGGAFFIQEVPGLFFSLGGLPKGSDPLKAAFAHMPGYFIDEGCMKTGIKAFLYLVTDYMQMHNEGKINLSVKN